MTPEEKAFSKKLSEAQERWGKEDSMSEKILKIALEIEKRCDEGVELYHHGSETTAAKEILIEFIVSQIKSACAEAREEGRNDSKEEIDRLRSALKDHNKAIETDRLKKAFSFGYVRCRADFFQMVNLHMARSFGYSVEVRNAFEDFKNRLLALTPPDEAKS